MPPTENEVLTELRIAVARIEERLTSVDSKLEDRFKSVDYKLNEAVVSREDLDKRLAPLIAHMNKGRGALAAMTLMAGMIGASVASVIKRMIESGSSP